MKLLTRKEAELVLVEAYHLKAEYADSKSRLGQSIWWCADAEQGKDLPEIVGLRLCRLLAEKGKGGIDFFHWTDDNKVLQCFYEHFVEQY